MNDHAPLPIKMWQKAVAVIVSFIVLAGCVFAVLAMSSSLDVHTDKDGIRFVELGSMDGRPVQWLILDEKPDGSKLLLSRYVLYADTYNGTLDSVTWETCGLRKYLNGDFYKRTFSLLEKRHIKKSWVVNKDNPYKGTSGGDDTRDKLFLISPEEAYEYFPFETWDEETWKGSSLALDTKPLVSADMENYLTWEGEAPGSIDNSSSWWLRSPGSIDNRYACIVDAGGSIRQTQTVNEMYGVRPAMWVR